MAIPNPELPHQGPLPGQAAAQGNRPLPMRPAPGGPAHPAASNRPIPLKPKSGDQLPDSDDEEELEDDSADLREVIRNAPAWLVSTVFHMILLIVLGLLVVNSGTSAAKLEMEVGYADDPGKQLEDPDVLVAESKQMEQLTTETMLTPKDLAPVDDPLVSPPVLDNINLATSPLAASASSDVASTPGIALALSGRQAGSKGALLDKYGGTADTEAAVELGLEWLSKQQRSDGSWSLQGPYPDGSTGENAGAATAMALLAFQGHGDTHRAGKYAKNVARGWGALLKMQRRDGSFTGGRMTEPIQQLYTHAQGTIAVCELYGMTSDSSFRGPADRAVAYAVESQDPKKGGWRYMPGQDSDTSVTGWFMMALQSARMAKLKVPDDTLRKITFYLDSAAYKDGRQYGYWMDANVAPAMSAEGLLCRQYLGWAQNDPRLVEGVTALLKNPVSYKLGDMVDVYYWYYATQAAHHMEGKIWDDWNQVMRREVPEHQIKDGPQAGSWDPEGDKWGSTIGRLYVTCLSIYNLEVYYRHLPIYSGYRAINALPPIGPAPDAATPDAEGDAKQAGEPAGKGKAPGEPKSDQPPARPTDNPSPAGSPPKSAP